MNVTDHPILIFDGACGTNLQEMTIPDSAWEGCEGCNELLNVTAPDCIVELHRSFLDAGAMVLETNTFGATRVVLAEYELQDRVDEINKAGVANARRAIGDRPNCYVAGSIGPGTKLPSLGHISYDDLVASYREQIISLVGAGVDLLILETCQDMLQVKGGLITAFEVLEEKGIDIPVMVSITVEQTGTMLVGTDIAAAAATLAPYPVMSMGLNCATGPQAMTSRIQYLSHHWPTRISCIPNQGLPEVINGKTHYPMQPDAYAKHMKRFVEDFGVSVVGGCCGTTPAHIRALVKALEGVTPAAREVSQ